jgi:drug/metabolite transporter (DMT)-like permease
VGLFELGITYIFWLKALQLSETTGKISNIVYLTPFVSLIFIHFVLRETIHYTSVVGLCLIVGGIMVGRTGNGHNTKRTECR